MSSDQQSGFLRRPNGVPLRITADNQFTSDERESLQAAVREWNQKSKNLIGSDIFVVAFDEVPASLRSIDPHGCSSDLGGDKNFYVVREMNQDHWAKLGFGNTTPGATIRCYDGTDRDSSMIRQIVYINPSLLAPSLFDSAFAHELGHSLGVEHSCTLDGGSSNYISCDQVKTDSSHPYFQAVMYPFLKLVGALTSGSVSSADSDSPAVPADRVSDVLNHNDTIRGECMTGPTE